MHIYTYTHIQLHTYTHIDPHLYSHTYILTYTYTLTYLYIHLHMHPNRSGTSVIGGLLSQMGLKTGGPLIGAAADNAKGFFERIDVVLQNDYLMRNQKVCVCVYYMLVCMCVYTQAYRVFLYAYIHTYTDTNITTHAD
jgi:hypothetical protein